MDIWRVNATRLGEDKAKELNIDTLPVNPIEIAVDQGITVEALPPENTGVSGMLVCAGSAFGILYATHINHIGFQNFSVAHELGHYFIPEHPEKILINGQHISNSGFTSTDQCELEADHFASGLLMPSYLFDKALEQYESGLTAIVSLANLCETSLTATAIRYAQRTPDIAAIIVSTKKTIDYCFMSDEMKEISGLNWIRKGTPLRRNTATYNFNLADVNIKNGNKVERETNLQEWFQSERSIDAYEEVKGLGAYGKTLTVITVANTEEIEESEYDEELEESWTPRFRK